MSFPYTTGVPNPPNNPSNDVTPMQTNTNTISNWVAIDHIGFNNTNAGKHTVIHLFPQSTPPVSAGFGQLYSKTFGSDQQLSYMPGSGNEYQLTRCISGSFSLFGANSSYGSPPAGFTQEGGWTFLPGGLLLQYGFYGKTGATGTSGNIQFPVTWTIGPYSISIALYRTSGNQTLTISSSTPPTTTQFSFLCSSAGSDGIYWSAIGN